MRYFFIWVAVSVVLCPIYCSIFYSGIKFPTETEEKENEKSE